MARNNNRPKPSNAAAPSGPQDESQEELDAGTEEQAGSELPEVGLGDLLGDGDNDPDMLHGTADRLRELTEVKVDPETWARMQEAQAAHVRGPGMELTAVPPTGPAAAHELREQRVTYPAKPAANCGETVQSLTKAELGNRTPLHKILCVCPEHHTPCYAGVREGIYTRMYCPVLGCNFSHKLVAPTTAELINRTARREQISHPQHDITPR